MYRSLCIAAAALACLSITDAFGLGAPSCRVSHTSKASSAASDIGRRSSSMVPPLMSSIATMAEASEVDEGESVSDVLADLDELDAVMGLEKEEQEDLMPKQAYLNKLAGQAAQVRWREHDNDTGSPRIQVAILTEKIVYLTRHMQENPHDFHSRRGLITLVTKRRKNLNYYYTQQPTACVEMCSALGIRFRPKMKIRGREQRYAAFKNTKSKIGNARRTELINKERLELRNIADEKKRLERLARGYK